MRIEPAQLALSPALPADRDFRFSVFASTRAEELALFGWSSEQQATFLKGQFTAQELSYTAAFPQAGSSVVYLGNVPVGILIVNRSSMEIRVVNIALLPEYRGRGLGREIMAKLQEEARTDDRPLRLQVLNGSPALRLYERLGFRTAGANDLYLQMEWSAAAVRSSKEQIR